MVGPFYLLFGRPRHCLIWPQPYSVECCIACQEPQPHSGNYCSVCHCATTPPCQLRLSVPLCHNPTVPALPSVPVRAECVQWTTILATLGLIRLPYLASFSGHTLDRSFLLPHLATCCMSMFLSRHMFPVGKLVVGMPVVLPYHWQAHYDASSGC